MTERNFKGIWIPAQIWICKDLTIQEKVMLVEIDSLDNDKGCFATNGYFAEFFGISKRRVSEIINNLIGKGFIKSTLIYKKDTKEIERRVLNICSPPYPLKVLRGIEGNSSTPTEGKFQENNTSFNNTINNTTNKEIDAAQPHSTPTSEPTKTKTSKPKPKFKPPTLDEVKAYCKERGNDVDHEYFIDFYASKDWHVGKNKMKDWKAAVRNAERWERKKPQNKSYNSNNFKYQQNGGNDDNNGWGESL